MNCLVHKTTSVVLRRLGFIGPVRACLSTLHAKPVWHNELLQSNGNPLAHRAVSILPQPLHNHQQIRNKTKKSGKDANRHRVTDDLEDDSPEEVPVDAYDDILSDNNSRMAKVVVNSMRADLLLKAGLGIARNKVDTLFYDSKIRVNGKKLTKKSAQLDVGDEIDVVRKASPTNPDHLVVSRVEILSVTPQSENLSVHLRRHKSLIIENYTE